MTISQIVSLIRNTIDENSVSSTYSDEFLWELFVQEKTNLIAQRLRKFNYINPQNEIKFCMELVPAKSHECGCIKAGCDVLTTTNSIPRFISGRNIGSLKVSLLDNRSVSLINDADYSILSDHPIYKNKVLASLINNKLVIYNDLHKRVIQVSALWEDVSEIQTAQYCNSDDQEIPTCKDVYNIDVGIDRDLVSVAVSMVIQKLQVKKSVIADITNDNNDEIKL